MMGIKLRGGYLCAQACLHYLKNTANPHIPTLLPPIALDPKWFSVHPGARH